MRAGHNMRHISVHLMREELPRASLALAELEAFVPDTRELTGDELPDQPGQRFRERVKAARGHLDRLVNLVGEPGEGETFLVLRREQVSETAEWLAEAWRQLLPIDEECHEVEEKLGELDQLDSTLDDFAGLDIDLADLQDQHLHLEILFGTLPASNLTRLREALGIEGHQVVRVVGEGETLRVVVAGLRDERSSMHKILTAAAFQPLQIPRTFRGEPEKVRSGLHRQRNALLKRRERLQHQLDNWVHSNRRRLAGARNLLDAAEPYLDVRGAARASGALAMLQGWLPAEYLARAERQLRQHLKLPFVLEARRPLPEERHLVPIPGSDSRLLRPFALLMQQYGVPRFGEFDPTLLFGITFAGMFGMMFGDVGHGMVFVLAGLLLRKRLGAFTPLLLLSGASATLFGFLYGSIFGVEHWLHPWWIAPMSDPMYMLSVALGWGVTFLSIGSLIAIANRLLAADLLGALFDPGGIFSLVLYFGLIGGLVGVIDGQGFPAWATAMIVLSLLLLIGFQWHESQAPFGERALTVLIETFEIVSGYVASSLSFLRVAAFSLNHVALSLAVFTLADMMDGVGQWAMIVFGNLFVIVLEGMIVTIQTLRLEYYEGFSRYFYGDGTRFVPLRPKSRRVAPVSANTHKEVSS